MTMIRIPESIWHDTPLETGESFCNKLGPCVLKIGSSPWTFSPQGAMEVALTELIQRIKAIKRFAADLIGGSADMGSHASMTIGVHTVSNLDMLTLTAGK